MIASDARHTRAATAISPAERARTNRSLLKRMGARWNEWPHRIVLRTGPARSGKTTTLSAAVDMIRIGREKILTVECPVEYELAGVPQVPVNEKVGTVAKGMRTLLDDGIRAVKAGTTTIDEVLRVARA